jgi:hypothetical protein
LRLIHKLLERWPAEQVAVWEDEIDSHLNPKIGPDYMLPGRQKTVLTPGKNIKRNPAGALDARAERLVWVEGGYRKLCGATISLARRRSVSA